VAGESLDTPRIEGLRFADLTHSTRFGRFPVCKALCPGTLPLMFGLGPRDRAGSLHGVSQGDAVPHPIA
jgi:hypothetical protein